MKKILFLLLLIATCSVAIELPIFMIPEKDMGNDIIDVFVEKYENRVEITVVFKDEDHPNPFTNFFYDIYRFFKYGRVKDIETFFLVVDEEKIKEVRFPGVYAGSLDYDDTENLHGTITLPAKAFEFKNGRIVIFVNSWNHMFSNKPLKNVKYVEISDYRISKGTREDAERIYSWRH